MMKEREEVFPCARDASLGFYVKTLEGSGQQNKPTVVILHDLFDYHACYLALAETLNELDHTVHLLDYRGFGRSAGARGVIDDHDSLVDDIEAFLCHLPGPAIVVGSGFGALLAIRLHHRGGLPVERRIQALVLVSPLLRMVKGIPELGNFVYARLRHPFDLVPLPWRLSAQEQTRCHDPLVRDQILLRTYRQVQKLTKLEQNASYLIDIPTLTMLPGSDTISSLSFVRLFNKAIDPGLGEIYEYPDSGRDLFNGHEKEKALKDLVSWLQKRFY